MNTRVHFSSASDEWATPQEFFDTLNREFGFCLDVCAFPSNAKCKAFIEPIHDSLTQDWHKWAHFAAQEDKARDGKPPALWMNPPYGRGIGKWVEKAAHESKRGLTVVCLLPARTDTAWWHDYVLGYASYVRLVRGRLKFGGGPKAALLPSAVVIFNPWGQRIATHGTPQFSAIDNRGRPLPRK